MNAQIRYKLQQCHGSGVWLSITKPMISHEEANLELRLMRDNFRNKKFRLLKITEEALDD